MAGRWERSIRGDGGADRYLGHGQFIESANGLYRAGVYNGTMGVIRLDHETGRWVDEMAVWGDRNDPVDKVWVQTDGNFVAYRADGSAIVESDTNTRKSTLIIQDDGNLVLYGPTGRATWSSREGTMRSGFMADLSAGAEVVYGVAKSIPGVSIVLAPVEAVVAFGGAVVSGENVIKAVGSAYDELKTGVTDFANSPLANMAVGVVANVPGFGTVGGAALSALIAVAKGESLTNIGLAALKGALPGQPLSGELFDAGLAIAKGQNVLKTAVAFGVARGGAVLSSAAGKYAGQALSSLTGGAASGLPSLQLPGGVKIPIGAQDLVNLGAEAYNQLRAKVPGDATAKSAFDLAVQLSAAAPDPQILEETRLSLTGTNRTAFEHGLALHAGVTVGKVAIESGAPQPELSKAVDALNTRVTVRKVGPAVAGAGLVAVAAALWL